MSLKLDAQASMFLSAVEAQKGPLPAAVFDALVQEGADTKLSEADVLRILRSFQLVADDGTEVIAALRNQRPDEADTQEARTFALHDGFALVIDIDGEPLIRVLDHETAHLAALGFTQVFERGLWALPKKADRPLMRGAFELPGGIALFVHLNGEVLVDPRQQDFVPLEEQGFGWAGETGMLMPPDEPGTYTLPGGTRLVVRENGGVVVDPGGHPAASLLAQGFSIQDKTGMLALPRQGGRSALRVGTYSLLGGALGLVVMPTGVFGVEPRKLDPEALLAQGFTWLGETGLLIPPL